MSDELRAAAEHILGFFQAAEEHPFTPLGRSAKKLAESYIAEHPADDCEPVTYDDLEAAFCNKNATVSSRRWNFFVTGTFVVNTRRDVRRLLAALGIEVPK